MSTTGPYDAAAAGPLSARRAGPHGAPQDPTQTLANRQTSTSTGFLVDIPVNVNTQVLPEVLEPRQVVLQNIGILPLEVIDVSKSLDEGVRLAPGDRLGLMTKTVVTVRASRPGTPITLPVGYVTRSTALGHGRLSVIQ